jgi:hypothetical protein
MGGVREGFVRKQGGGREGRARSVVMWMMNRILMQVLSQTTVYAENITLEN